VFRGHAFEMYPLIPWLETCPRRLAGPPAILWFEVCVRVRSGGFLDVYRQDVGVSHLHQVKPPVSCANWPEGNRGLLVQAGAILGVRCQGGKGQRRARRR